MVSGGGKDLNSSVLAIQLIDVSEQSEVSRKGGFVVACQLQKVNGPVVVLRLSYAGRVS